MPKTLLEKIVFTVVMAAIMVYGMIVYNVALATGGVTNATFGMALHEMPIMVPVAFVLEFFVVEKLATALAFTFMRPWVHTFGCNFPMALCWQMFYCGPLSRFIFRAIFRRGGQNAQ